MLVDDTPYNLKVLSNLLLQKGHEVRPALNGEIALKAVETDLPDVILLGYFDARLDGYQVCERLYCEKTANIPYFTAIDEIEYKVKVGALAA